MRIRGVVVGWCLVYGGRSELGRHCMYDRFGCIFVFLGCNLTLESAPIALEGGGTARDPRPGPALSLEDHEGPNIA